MVSPLYIEIGLHYYCRGDDYHGLEYPAVKDAVADFIAAGLLEPATDGKRQYAGTDGLTMWVHELCGTPFPVRKWMMPAEVRDGERS